MKHILLIHPEGNINDNPSLSGIVEILCENGHTVEIVSPRRPGISQKPPCAGATIRLIDSADFGSALYLSFLVPQDLFEKQDLLHTYLNQNFGKADFIFGVDRGIFDAFVISRSLGIPYGLISYEIYFAEEAGKEFKEPEILACQGILFAVCQDRVRAALLSRENRIPLDKIIDIPVGGRGFRQPLIKSFRIHDSLNLSRDTKIALYMGSITSAWSMIGELLQTTPDWQDGWVLLLHHRYGPQTMQDFFNRFPFLKYSDKVFLSPFSQLDFDDLSQVLHEVDLGLAFYAPQKNDFTAGNNLKYIGMASGKIASYLQYGLPVMINEIGEMSDHVRQNRLGVVIKDIVEIPSLLDNLSQDELSEYRGNARRFFGDRMDLNVTIKPLLKILDSPSARKSLRSAKTNEVRVGDNSRNTMPGDCSIRTGKEYAKENMLHLQSVEKYPKISIITPSFNQGQFLEACIDSVLSQKYPNLEYIIMDGGSTDKSVEIIKKYEKHLTYWQSKQDNGQYAAINEGFRKTTGEIMTWINSDDILHPESLEVVAGIFSRFGNVEWIMGWPNGIDEQGRQTWVFDYLPLWSREKYLRRQYRDPCIQQEGTFWKRTLWERAGGSLDTSWKLAGDMELWARFFRDSHLYSVAALLGAFRKHPGQKTAAFLEEYYREAEKIIDREIMFYNQGADKTLPPPPPPISAEQIAAPGSPAAAAGSSISTGTAKPKIRVSAIVSTYNSERFMRGCLEDLIHQTLYQKGELEIIVVDSGSQQNERTIVEEFRKKYGNITYMRTEYRETVYAAWNKGIRAASGHFVTNANTDDRHRKDALEVMCNLLETNPTIGLVYADVIITETENETFENHTRTGQYQWPDFDRAALSIGCFIGPQPMWRKSLHDRHGYFDESFSASGDWEFWLRIAEDAKFLHIPEFLGIYLRSPRSLEHQNAGKRIEEDRSIYKTYIPKYLPAYDGYFAGTIGTDPNPLHVYRYGQVLAAFDRFDEAISLYESYVKRNPAYQGFNFLLNDLKNAKAIHGAAQPPPAAPLPEEVMAYLNQADRHIANNDHASAREAIKQALRYTSGHPQLTAMLSNMLAHLEFPEAAENFLGTKGKDD